MTAQVHEQLVLDGRPASMTTCPPLPLHDPRLVAVDPASPTPPESANDAWLTSSTSCWRRYLGTWEIRDDRLYLRSVIGRYSLNTNEPLFADWVSGILTIPQGELLEYVHMGFESLYEQELEVFVEAGVVVDRCVVDHRSDFE